VAGDADFECYHVLLLKKIPIQLPLIDRFSVFASYPVFKATAIEGMSTEVRVNRWRRFEGDVLRAHFGDRWPEVLAAELTESRRAFLRIDGEDAEGRRVKLPQSPDPVVAAGPRKAGRRPGSGMSVLIRHLRDVERIEDYDVLLTMCERSGVEWAKSALDAGGVVRGDRLQVLRKAYSNGKARHDGACPYCADGLSEPWRTLVAAYK